MNSPNDKTSAKAEAWAPDADYLAQLPPSRARLQTLVGVAPAAPIVTGRPDGPRSSRDAEAMPPEPQVDDAQVPPTSRVRPRLERPELPRVMMASKHTLDAVSVHRDESLPVAQAPVRTRKGGVLLVALAVAAVLALVAVRRGPHHLPALLTPRALGVEPAVALEIDLPPVAPASLSPTALTEAPAVVAAPTVASVAPRPHPTHKHSQKRPHAPAPASASASK